MRLTSFKRRLKKAYPNIPHMHRLEAAARGLGYPTYAALKLDTTLDIELENIQLKIFYEYLANRGIEDDPQAV